MKDQFSSDFGKQLSQIVQDAVQSGDYSQLKQAVDVTVKEIKSSADSVKNAWTQGQPFTPPQVRPGSTKPHSQPGRPIYTPPPTPPPRTPSQGAPPQNRPPQGRPAQGNASYQGAPSREPARPRPRSYATSQPAAYPSRPVYSGQVINPYKRKIPGNAASILLLVFGILGLVASGTCTAALLPMLYLERELLGFIVASAICLPLDLNFLLMIVSGNRLRGRVNRFRRYMSIMNGARYFSIEQLAAATGESKDFLVKDLRKMIRKGMFPCAFIDEQNTCLILDRDTYQQYLNTRNNLEQKRLEEERQRQIAKNAPPQEAPSAVVREGQGYIRQIKEANDAIPNEEISAKLYRMETITTQIFGYVEKHPNKLPEIRKFMNYYLPTTLKLVNAYREFDAQTVSGNNIVGTKKEIQEILDTINVAFENLLDSLFEDDAMDISSDISALNIMLAQDGLKESDFKLEQ